MTTNKKLRPPTRRGAPYHPRKPNSLAEHLLQLRIMRNLTIVALKEKSGISASTLSRIENGHQRRMKKETIEKLCIALEIEPPELLLGNTHWIEIENSDIPIAWFEEPKFSKF